MSENCANLEEIWVICVCGNAYMPVQNKCKCPFCGKPLQEILDEHGTLLGSRYHHDSGTCAGGGVPAGELDTVGKENRT